MVTEEDFQDGTDQQGAAVRSLKAAGAGLGTRINVLSRGHTSA